MEIKKPRIWLHSHLSPQPDIREVEAIRYTNETKLLHSLIQEIGMYINFLRIEHESTQKNQAQIIVRGSFLRYILWLQNPSSSYLCDVHRSNRCDIISLVGRVELDRFVLLRNNYPDHDRVRWFHTQHTANQIDHNLLWDQRCRCSTDFFWYHPSISHPEDNWEWKGWK